MKIITKIHRTIWTPLAFLLLSFSGSMEGMFNRRPDIQAIRQRYQSSKIPSSLNTAREMSKAPKALSIDIDPKNLKTLPDNEIAQRKQESLAKIEQLLETINP